MNAFVKYILFRMVLLIIALHAIIPHPHSNQLSQENHSKLHKNSNSLVGILRLVFHESNDENLDNLVFEQNEQVDTDSIPIKYVDVSILTNFQAVNFAKKVALSGNYTTTIFKKLLCVNLNKLRGPPLKA